MYVEHTIREWVNTKLKNFLTSECEVEDLSLQTTEKTLIKFFLKFLDQLSGAKSLNKDMERLNKSVLRSQITRDMTHSCNKTKLTRSFLRSKRAGMINNSRPNDTSSTFLSATVAPTCQSFTL